MADPPSTQSIGLLSLLVAEIERHPHKAILARSNPIYSLLQCQAAFASDSLSDEKLDLILKSGKSDKALKKLETLVTRESKRVAAQLRTTTAVDLIEGQIYMCTSSLDAC